MSSPAGFTRRSASPRSTATTTAARRNRSLAPERRKRILLVAAVALVDADGRVLLAQRPEGKTLAGLWEFPGGKVEPGETPEETLVREASRGNRHRNEGRVPRAADLRQPRLRDFHLLMPLYVCRRFWGTPQPLEAQALKWVRPRQMRDYPMPPADEPLIPFLIDLL